MKDFKFVGRSSGDGWLRDLLILATVLGIPFLLYLGALPLIDPDEGRYAEIPREMLERGDFLTPTLNYVKYFEKPPLLYWINAASLKLFGLNEFAARLPSALCGILTVLATYIIARRVYGRRTAILSAVILGTSIGFVIQSRIILTDMLLTLCLTGALGAFIIAAQREGRRSQEIPWYLFYFFCALATLTKGLIGIVFPTGIIFWYMLIAKRWRLLKEMRLLSGTFLYFAISAPWFILVSLKNPEFANFFFIHEHFERFTSTVHGRYQPFWFFLPILFATMLPWSLFIPAAIARAWRNKNNEEGKGGLFLVIWTIVIFLFFSKSNSKLIPYILPIFPPLAILIANSFDAFWETRGQKFKSAGLVTGILMISFGVAFVGYAYLPEVIKFIVSIFPTQTETLNNLLRDAPSLGLFATILLGSLFVIMGICSCVFSQRNIGMLCLSLSISAFTISIFVPKLLFAPISNNESPRDLSLKALKSITPEAEIVTFGPMQGVSWYMKRRVMVMGILDELTFGSKQGDQSLWFPTPSQWFTTWSSKKHILVFINQKELDYLLPRLQPQPKIIAQSGRRFVISNW